MIGASPAYYDPFALQHHTQSVQHEHDFYMQSQRQSSWQQHQQQQQQQMYQQLQQQQQLYPQNTNQFPAFDQQLASPTYLPYQQQQQLQQQAPPVVQLDDIQSDGKKEKEKDKRAKARKRRRARPDSSDDESDNDARNARPPGACTHCKRLKMRCEFPDDENVCRRCKAGGHECIVEGRKPRTAPNKREYLLAQIRQQDRTIQYLLKQLEKSQGASSSSVPVNAASPPASSTFNPSIPDSGAGFSGEDGRSEAILHWLNRAARSPSAGLESEPAIELSITDVDQPPPTRHSLPPEPAPLGMLANLAIRDVPSRPSSSVGDPEENSEGEIGVARSDYFPNSGIDSRRLAQDEQARPELLVKGIVTFEEVDELFDIFFSRLNVFLTILDPVLHTPASTFARCPFLFTIVCATAARYYPKRPELYTVAMHFAREAASRCVTQGFKSVELCQAYIIMATYAVPAKRWEEDRNWLYIGLAIRIATDLNLHLAASTKPTTETQERELLNRTRVWLICFNLDRSTSTQFGKMATLREDYIIRRAAEWYHGSPHNSKYDVHMCAYTQLLRVMARFVEEVFSDENNPTGLNKNVDWLEVTNRYNNELLSFEAEQEQRFRSHSDPNDPGCVYRTYLLPFLLGYSKLVMHSFGFQNAIDRGVTKGDVFFKRCMDAATLVCTTVLDKLAPTGYLRYAPDGHFLFAAFASAFLIKMLRLEYAHLVDGADRDRIVALLTRVIDTLGSRDISIDDKHTPKLYSRFLAGLLARQQAAAKEARSRGRRVTPKSSASPLVQADGLHVPAPVPMLQQTYVPQPQLHVQDNLLHVADISDAGTETTIERPDELTQDEMLAGMHALNSPAWWTGVMMPGYSWQSDTPVYAPTYGVYPGAQQQQQQQQLLAPVQQPGVGGLLSYMGPQ